MERRSQPRDELFAPAEIFVRGKLRAVMLVDLSVNGILVQRPDGLELAEGETVAIRLYGMPTSALAHIRWSDGEYVGLEFRKQLHPSVVDFMLNDYNNSVPFDLSDDRPRYDHMASRAA